MDQGIALSVCCGHLWGGQASVLVLIDEIVGWRSGLDDLLARFAHRFGRAEPRRQALRYLVGLLSPLASRKVSTSSGRMVQGFVD